MYNIIVLVFYMYIILEKKVRKNSEANCCT